MKDFFTRQIFINSLVFAVPVSILMLWRASYIEDISFFSAESLPLFGIFVAINCFLFLFIFFILYLLGGKKKEE